ncbi:mitogen-activated kinase kinase kinase 3-like isoform X2 [Olea europaea subsp. europaea]|uniref:mitogen-activated protein kinase kinase kinase n=1 Tax=Olea europaea subsp. europaea TaxID=158383 RepID=A0A8S0U100_OLEEU|nr:mitogen-activated kinase kinase kinase 3-like isoform X2 [Olea europaea subsp. europaea]
MPTWWGKKTIKSENSAKDSSNSPRRSRSFSTIGERGGGHPLPSPLESSSEHNHARGAGCVSGSSSVSSVGSSESSYDHAQVVVDHAFRESRDKNSSPLLRSPSQGARVTTNITSPLHLRCYGINMDSPTRKSEDGKSECHRLPLPPGSPASLSMFPTQRSPGITKTSSCNPSKWRKGRLLGRGTFGHVYLGFNCESGQMCAIKEVRVILDDRSSKECLKQLNQEIDLLSRLSHVNIVQYYGSDLSEETLSVYLEYVSGGSIQKLLQEYGPFAEPVIQNYTRQILLGLAYLHGKNTVHRDIKGANILVGPNGEIKLADFGMAKPINSCPSMLSFKGSPYWMAPEVVTNTNGYSLLVDIWSLGCTVLEMATSKPPWGQYEGVAAIFKIGNSKDIPEIPDHLSPDAKSFIRLCLQREPSSRPMASQLLAHPFVRNQTAIRAANVPHALDRSLTTTSSELLSSRMSNSFNRDDTSRPIPTTLRTLSCPRDSARTMVSLPVTPISSPLRYHGSVHTSRFFSPTHPSYTFVDQSIYNQSDQSLFPVELNTRRTLDQWLENPRLKAQTPVRSATRTIL